VFGTGDCGQFGRGEDVSEASRPIPSQLPSDAAAPAAGANAAAAGALKRRALQVAPGGMHTLALADDGTVWSTGVNDEGALGRPTAGEVWDGEQEEEAEAEQEAAEDADGAEALAPAKKAKLSAFDPAPHLPRGDPYSWGRVAFPEGAGPFVQVSAGDSHSCALAADGRVFAWGTFRDASGVFGFAPGLRIARSPACVHSAPRGPSAAAARAVKVCSGADHALALTAGGDVLSWGTAGAGALGRVGERLPPRRAALEELLLRPARVKFPGGGSGAPRIEDVFAGTYSSFAVASGGRAVFGWGLNNYGQLSVDNGGAAVLSPVRLAALERAAEGGGSGRVRPAPTAAEAAPAAPAAAAAAAAGAPAAPAASLGLSGAVPEVAALVAAAFAPLLPPPAPPAAAEDMEVEGGEAAAAPAPPRSPSPPLPAGLFPSSVASIGAGQHHTLALTSSGVALAFGRPTYGRLGAAGADPSSDEGAVAPVRVDASKLGASARFSAVSAGLAVSGGLVVAGEPAAPLPAAWGFGDSGQLGKHSSSENADGDELAPRLVDLPPRASGRQALSLEFGGQHAVLLVALSPEEEAADAAARAEAEARAERERLAKVEAERAAAEAAAAAKEAEERAKREAAERAAEEKRVAAEAAAAKKAEEARLKKEAAEKVAAEKAAVAAAAAAAKEREKQEKAEAKARASEEKARLKAEAEAAKEAERQAKVEAKAEEEEAARVAAEEAAAAKAAAEEAAAAQAQARAEAEEAERAAREAAEAVAEPEPVVEEPVSRLPSPAAEEQPSEPALEEAAAADGGEEALTAGEQAAPAPVVEEPEELGEGAPAAPVAAAEEDALAAAAPVGAGVDPSPLDPAAFMASAPPVEAPPLPAAVEAGAAAGAVAPGPPFPGQLVETGVLEVEEEALEVAPVDAKEPSPGDFFNAP
jgi:regulator of chromosome condensation